VLVVPTPDRRRSGEARLPEDGVYCADVVSALRAGGRRARGGEGGGGRPRATEDELVWM
jgi:hypothetical protein